MRAAISCSQRLRRPRETREAPMQMRASAESVSASIVYPSRRRRHSCGLAALAARRELKTFAKALVHLEQALARLDPKLGTGSKKLRFFKGALAYVIIRNICEFCHHDCFTEQPNSVSYMQ